MNAVKRGRGQPPKAPEDRRDARMDLPMTDAEKAAVVAAAEARGVKPVTWARETLLRAAKRAR